MKNTALFIGIIICIWLPSCAPVLYNPNMLSAPSLEKQGDLTVTAGIGAKEEDLSFEFQGAYAFTDHIAGLVNFSTLNIGSPERYINYKNRFFELGGGYYSNFGPSFRGKDLFQWQVFTGIGRGKAEGHFDDTEGNNPFCFFCPDPTITTHEYKSTFYRGFVQPGFAMKMKYFEVGFAGRISAFHFDKFAYHIDGVLESNSVSMVAFEPTVTVKAGWKNIKFFMQSGLFLANNNDAIENKQNYWDLFGTVDATNASRPQFRTGIEVKLNAWGVD